MQMILGMPMMLISNISEIEQHFGISFFAF